MQSIVARNASPHDAAVVSITQIHGGDAYNVIPQKAVLRGTARAFTKAMLKLIEDNMRRISENVAAGFGATAELDFRTIFQPLVNHEGETEFACAAAADLVGEENVDRKGPLIMASEDFAAMLDVCPGAYITIGNGEGEGMCEVHNPGYDFNDEILALGASYYVRLAERWLAADAA